ncbi:MAG: PLP-dependent aminotransferase family protein [Acidiferrobacterales bacterium]
MRDPLLYLSPTSTASLQAQIREMLVSAILDGHIPGGDALPSCRRLATQLGVARNTVVIAYQQLVDQGYLIAHERSGYYVNQDILVGRATESSPIKDIATAAPDWTRRLKLRPSLQRNIVKPRDWQKYPYPFIYGQFDAALFPIADWRGCAREALSVTAIRDWARDRVDSDDPLLIEQLHTRVLPRRGVWATPEEILVTVGAQQALYLLANLLIDDDSTVGIEDPGYPDARNIFDIRTSRVIGLPVDELGLTIDPRLDGCDCIYVTPSHQFPTTVTMPLARRHELLRHAADCDFVIIEDDYENETNFVGDPTPALKSLNENDRVIYVGSLSKTLAPGLRLGYMVGPVPLIREARALRRLSHAFRDRWQAMGDALTRYLPDSARVPSFGGTSYWVKGPAGLDAKLLERKAREQGILIEAGDVHFLSDQPPLNYFRLGFSSIQVDRIDPGIGKLADLIHESMG